MPQLCTTTVVHSKYKEHAAKSLFVDRIQVEVHEVKPCISLPQHIVTEDLKTHKT